MSTPLEELVEELRSRGSRITLPRRWTLQVLHDENRHMTVEELQQSLTRRGVQVDEATLYRTLQWLKQNRVVAQMTTGSGADVYALLGDRRHHHLICVECGSISEIGDELFQTLRESIRSEYGFVPHIDHYAIPGLCAACCEQRAGGEAAPAAAEEPFAGLPGHAHA